ncbi:DNA-binding protein, partial [Streptomyces toxytricini]
AWETALAELQPAASAARHGNSLTIVEAWPYLIVANERQVRVLDADSTVLTHDLRAPTGNAYRHGFHYVDGALLVFWSSWNTDEVKGYWHTDPATVFTVGGDRNHWSLRSTEVSLPLPGGGRTTGGGVLHAGDTALPPERSVLCDGTSYWVWQRREQENGGGWCEYDPADGARGRFSQPAFLADALRGHPAGSTLSAGAAWLRPAPAVDGSALGPAADGLLGWHAVRIPGQGWYGRDTAGRSVRLPEGRGMPLAALAVPGDDRPRGLTQNWRALSITDPDGVVTTVTSGDHRSDGFSTGAVEQPPLPFWYALRPRDPEGSAALRTADAGTAAALMKAVAAAEKTEDLPDLVRAVLPQVTDAKLIAGIIDVARFALRQQRALDAIAARLNPGEAAPARSAETAGPTDQLLAGALRGVIGSGYYHWSADQDVSYRFLHRLAAAAADTDAASVPGRLHFDAPALDHSGLPFTAMLDHPAAIAYRAVGPAANDAQRAALCAVLA